MSDIEASKPPAAHNTLSWEGVDYQVSTPTQGRLHILHNVSGYALGGRLLAVMGASGSGKTTLLDILCNRKRLGSSRSEDVHGNILINGSKRGITQTLSYVPQHDNLLNTATVRETLEIAALLRIGNITESQAKERVETVLNDLGLGHRADALVGGGEIRSLSGGERRRVSIGQEIVSSQNTVLCLDEPTTGLDSTTAESVMSCLRDLARLKGIIIVATIHQPNSFIANLFDDLMLMGKGHLLYSGLFSEAVNRFSLAGFACPTYCNPTDFFIRIAADEENLKPLSECNMNWLREQRATAGTPAQLGFHRSAAGSGDTNSDVVVTGVQCAASTFQQIKLLCIRDAKQWYRDPGMLISEFIQYIFFAVFLGGMYYNIDDKITTGTYDRSASLFFILAILVFTPPFTAVFTFSAERTLFTKERSDNMYSAFSWLTAKTLVLAPVEALLCLVFSSIFYFMAGYQPSAEKFFLFLVILILFQMIGESTGMLFAALLSSPVLAIISLSLFLIIVLSLSGFLTSGMPVYYKWIEDSNVLRFAMLGLIQNEFTGLTLHEGGLKSTGTASLPQSLQPFDGWVVGDYIGVLVAFLVGFRFLIYLALLSSEFDKYLAVIVDWCENEVAPNDKSADDSGDKAMIKIQEYKNVPVVETDEGAVRVQNSVEMRASAEI